MTDILVDPEYIYEWGEPSRITGKPSVNKRYPKGTDEYNELLPQWREDELRRLRVQHEKRILLEKRRLEYEHFQEQKQIVKDEKKAYKINARIDEMTTAYYLALKKAGLTND